MFKPYQPKALTTAILAGLLTLTGCSNPDTPVSDSEAQGDTIELTDEDVTVGSPQADANADPSAKLNAYIDCTNNMTSGIYDSYNRYADWVSDMAVGPTGNESVVYGIYDLNDTFVKKCTDDAMAATTMSPSLPELDEAAKVYIAALKEYDDISKQASKYYEQSNYKDDDFALGKELHPKLVSSFEALDQASDNFNGLISDLDKQQRAETLQALEQTEGRKYNFLLLSTLDKADAMTEYMLQDDFDPEQAAVLIKDYEDISTELSDYIATDAEDLPSMISFVESSLDGVLVAGKERMRRIRDNEKYSEFDVNAINNGQGEIVEGSAQKLNAARNNLIENVNRMN